MLTFWAISQVGKDLFPAGGLHGFHPALPCIVVADEEVADGLVMAAIVFDDGIGKVPQAFHIGGRAVIHLDTGPV